MKIGYQVENTETLVCFLMGERLKKSTHLHLLSHQRINICFAVSSAHKFTPVCFSISLVYPVPVSSHMSIHKYDSPHYLYHQ